MLDQIDQSLILANQLELRDVPGLNVSGYIPLAAAARLIPPRRAGRPCSLPTLYRWSDPKRGCRGTVLRTAMVGCTRCTRAEWLAEFISELTRAAGLEPATAIRTASQCERAGDAAGNRLEKRWKRMRRRSRPVTAK